GTALITAPEARLVPTSHGSLSLIELKGGVMLSDGPRRAMSQTLSLDLAQNQFTFDGQPKVYHGDDEISGERIVFLEGGRKVKIEKIRAKLEKLEQ
ncbi:MAG: hypothetical protein N2578_10105, partial [Bdellovibrionaceae bacterium]|nr:hypothetical protein [Pseudobdellovibrionaceae bacterium]